MCGCVCVGWGVTVCQSEGTHQIVMSFSPPVVGCLLQKAHKRGGSQAPQDPPATPLFKVIHNH